MSSELILASASPRRQAMLASFGLAFRALPAAIDESVIAGELAEAYVHRIARAKAATIAQQHPYAWVIGCDTAVVAQSKILGKPRDRRDAERMLSLLSDAEHEVMTALVVLGPNTSHTKLVKTKVSFGRLSIDDIAEYCATEEPYDKAGAYAIQGFAQRFVRSIDGSYSSVVGLPLCELRELLEREGFCCGFSEHTT